MRLAPVRCRVLLHSLLPTDDVCSSSSLSTTVIKFSIFSDPTRKLSAVRIGCGGRPAGWHDYRHMPAFSLFMHARSKNSKKNLLSTDGCSTRNATFRELRRTKLQTPEIHAPHYCS